VNVSSSDPLTFLFAAAFLAMVALVASFVPALRAMRVDPITALRSE
jgi:putative ABC transport system permease protein